MTIPKSASLQDLMYAAYLAASPAADLGLGVTLGQGLVTISQQVNLTASTKQASGTSAAAPASGTAIATLNIATAGYYKVQVVVGFGATAESTTVDNFAFKNNGSTVGTCPASNTANWQSQTYEFYVNVGAGASLTVNVGGTNGSAGSIYKASIFATRQA